MRYPATEKLEIIRLTEQSHIPANQVLDRLGIPCSTFYLLYDKYIQGSVNALEDKAPMPAQVWNRIPDDVREKIVKLALKEPVLSPRELAIRFTETERYFMICAANGIEHRLTKPNHPWTNGQVERMNRIIKHATIKRYHYNSHDQLRTHLSDFLDA